MSKETGIDAQEILQAFFLERILDRISKSKYKNNFIIKGGLLVASMIGINSRSTKDLDATVKYYPVAEEDILQMVDEVLNVVIEDNVSFEIQSINRIREEAEYEGYRLVVVCRFEKIMQHVKIDISTGDAITPKEVSYKYKSNFGYEDIEVMSYNIETVFAEKLESIISKADTTTRMRDFYDVYVLYGIYSERLDMDLLLKALRNTMINRNTIEALEISEEIMVIIRESQQLNELWNAYSNKYVYAKSIKYNQVINAIEEVLGRLKYIGM